MRTTAEKKAFDTQAMGCTAENLRESKPVFMDTLLYAMAILSDAQEMIDRNDGETARQFINRAKLLMIDERRARGVRGS